MVLRLFAIAALTVFAGCRSVTAPPVIDPDIAACLTASTVLLAGLDLDRLSGTPLAPMLAVFPGHPSRVFIASDGRDVLVISKGNFREAPQGSTLIKPDLAISGPAD